MLDIVTGTQNLIFTVLALGALALKVWAFVDCVRHKPELYPAADKRTKNFWLLVTGLSLAVGLISPSPLSIFNIAGVVGAGIYLADVRPALRQVSGKGGSTSSGGPYGGW